MLQAGTPSPFAADSRCRIGLCALPSQAQLEVPVLCPTAGPARLIFHPCGGGTALAGRGAAVLGQLWDCATSSGESAGWDRQLLLQGSPGWLGCHSLPGDARDGQ